MPTIYPTAAGAWSTRTWRNDADGSLYGTTPQPGDIVKANGLAITIDTNITVLELQTSAGTFAAAGGGFTTSGIRIINAIIRAGTSSCLVLGSGCTLNGDCYGGSANAAIGCIVNVGLAIINGNCYAGSNTSCHGANFQGGFSRLNGNTYGSNVNAAGATFVSGSTQIGNAYGGSTLNSAALGSSLSSGSVLFGDSFGGTGSAAGPGANLANGGVHIGNSTGTSGSNGWGTIAQNGGIHYGMSIGSSTTANVFGTVVQNGGLVISTGVTTNISKGIRLADASSAVLLNGVLESQLDITALPGRYIIGNSRHPFVGILNAYAAQLVGLGGLVQ